eukprot:m.243808 g.243808  ORF g.243808 m.243808 type:complete len:149 (-) comp17143_c0_seq4:1970-2416(-)
MWCGNPQFLSAPNLFMILIFYFFFFCLTLDRRQVKEAVSRGLAAVSEEEVLGSVQPQLTMAKAAPTKLTNTSRTAEVTSRSEEQTQRYHDHVFHLRTRVGELSAELALLTQQLTRQREEAETMKIMLVASGCVVVAWGVISHVLRASA